MSISIGLLAMGLPGVILWTINIQISFLWHLKIFCNVLNLGGAQKVMLTDLPRTYFPIF